MKIDLSFIIHFERDKFEGKILMFNVCTQDGRTDRFNEKKYLASALKSQSKLTVPLLPPPWTCES